MHVIKLTMHLARVGWPPYRDGPVVHNVGCRIFGSYRGLLIRHMGGIDDISTSDQMSHV